LGQSLDNLPIVATDCFKTIDVEIGLSGSVFSVERSLSRLIEGGIDERSIVGTSVERVDAGHCRRIIAETCNEIGDETYFGARCF